jgi:hypothetical protein
MLGGEGSDRFGCRTNRPLIRLLQLPHLMKRYRPAPTPPRPTGGRVSRFVN